MMPPVYARRISLILVLVFSFQNAVAALNAGGDQPGAGHPQHDSDSLVSPPGHHDHTLQAVRPDSPDFIVTTTFRCDDDPLCSCCAGSCVPALAGIWSVSEPLASGAVFLPLSAPQPARMTITLFRPPIMY